MAHVKGKEIDLVRLIEVLTASLINDGNCKVKAGCAMEGIEGNPSIVRTDATLYFDFSGADVYEDERIVWGETEI